MPFETLEKNPEALAWLAKYATKEREWTCSLCRLTMLEAIKF